jgi:hypothetical protein
MEGFLTSITQKLAAIDYAWYKPQTLIATPNLPKSL